MKVSFSGTRIFGLESVLLRVLILPIVLVLFILIIGVGVVVPKIGEIGQSRQEFERIKQEVNSTEEKVSYLRSIDQAEMMKKSKQLESALLREKNSYYLVNVVRKVALDYGFQMQSFSVSLGVSKGEAKENMKAGEVTVVPLDIKLAGQREKYLELLSAIETSLPVMAINNFKMKVVGGVAEIDLNLNAYYFSERKETNLTAMKLSDFVLTEDESKVLEKLGGFDNVGEVSGMFNAGQGKTYVKYERANPFFQ